MRTESNNSKDHQAITYSWLGKLPIRHKLMLIIMLVSSAVLLLAGGVFIMYGWLSAKQNMVEHLSVLTEMVADNCEGSLSFNDAKDAQDVLSSLQAEPSIEFACIYQKNGAVFATYHRSDYRPGEPPALKPDGHYFDKGRLSFFQQINLNHKPIGTVCLQSDLEELFTFLAQSATTVAIMILASYIVAYGLSMMLQRLVSMPIFYLAKIAGTVSVVKDYSVRATKHSEDELGLLTDSFNNMLSQVQSRDAALRESEEKYRTLFESLPQKIFYKDKNSVYVSSNENFAKDLNIKAENIKGMTDYEFFPKELADKYREDDKKIISLGSTESIEEAYIQEGQQRVVQTVKTPIKDEKGNATGVLGIFWDITDKKMAEIELENHKERLEELVGERTQELNEANKLLQFAKEKAEAANRAKSLFLANMSHELRTPLNAILGFTQLMTRDKAIPEERLEELGIISRSGEHLLTLINDILDIAKIEAGQTILTPKIFNLYQFMQGIEEMFHSRAMGKGMQFVMKKDTGLPVYVKADENKLRQVLINLLGNAIKFTEKGSISLSVTIGESEQTILLKGEARVAPTVIHFEVKDTGVGISGEHLQNIFDPFVQADHDYDTAGTGLGLAISHEFVQLMQGRINVKSEAGRGSAFWFDIPVEVIEGAEADTVQISRLVEALAPDQPDYRILIVEDRKESRMLLGKILKKAGFDVKEAVDGKEGLELFESWHPQLIWMDMRMPVMDGYDATRAIRNSKSGNRDVPIIALTAHAFEEERKEIVEAGCDELLRKPFREAEIFDLIAKYLGVRYVYKEEQHGHEPSSGETLPKALDHEALANLPTDLAAKLKNAAIECDSDLVSSVIDRIRDHDATIADGLAQLAKGFRYDRILELMEQGKS